MNLTAIHGGDPEEAQRMSLLRRPIDRARFGAAHAGMRTILGAYLRRPPAEVAFELEAGDCSRPGAAPTVGCTPLGR
jgi:hypothetical protein